MLHWILVCFLLLAIECRPESCCAEFQDPPPEMIGASHTEGKGLGYSRGYTSLDLFLSQPLSQKRIVPFLDLRGHMFNDAEYAANAGLGFRWIRRRYVWGVNIFYDYFETPRRPYNQVSMGLECLSTTWDVRLNGYLPVGHKETDLYEFSYLDISPDGFLLKGTEQFAMKGIDLEVGHHFYNEICQFVRDIDLYAGLGPYFYWGRSTATENAFRPAHKHIYGGRFCLSASYLDYVSIEGIVTYDTRFKWGGQAIVALTLPFDFTFSSRDCGECKPSYCLRELLYQPVRRNEIMVIDRIHRYSKNPNILDPENEP